MSRNLLLYSRDFHINLKKQFKSDDVHMIDINAEVLNISAHKNNKLMCELVKCLFEGYDKLTLITNFVSQNGYEDHFGEHSLAFILKKNDIKDTYELNDFYASVMSHLTSHRLLVESQLFLKKELVSSTLSKSTTNLKSLNALINDYEILINKSKLVFDTYREDIVLRFGVK